MNLENKTVLITGAGSGIGFEIARLLKESGNQVIIVGRNKDKIERAGATLGVTALTYDIANADDVEALSGYIKQHFPHLSILVNNAGVAHLYKLGVDADAYAKAKQEFDVNYFGPLLLTEKLLPILKKQPEAAIVNITSNVTFHPLVVLPTYSDSKAALHSHTVALRHGLAKDSKVLVYEVMPSLVNTDATKNMGGENGMHPREVAEATINGIKNDQYEIYVGDTAAQRQAWFADPVKAVSSFNAGL